MPSSMIGTFQGNAQAFQAALSNEPILIAASLVVVYVILGVLYESYIHPLTILSTLPSAGVGALLALMLGGFDLSVIGIIGIILLIGIVKKNGIMLVDFAINRERAGLPPREAMRQACLLRFRPIMMTTMTALLERPAADVRPRLGLGTAPAARLRHGRRAGAEPDADIVHHAGDLSLSRPLPDRGCAATAPSTKKRKRCRSPPNRPRGASANSFHKKINRNFARNKAVARNPAEPLRVFSL